MAETAASSPAVADSTGLSAGVAGFAEGLVFLLDVDNTLLDNDRIRSDIREHLERELGPTGRDRYWQIEERLFVELG